MARINTLDQSIDLAGEKGPSLERVLSSGGRIRILTLLSEIEELHLTEIAKRTEQSYSATERHLGDLSDSGIVEERDYGRVRVFRLNRANNWARLVQEMILKWNKSQKFQAVQAHA